MSVFARIKVTLGVTLMAIALTCGVMAGVCLDVVAINKNLKIERGNKGYIFQSDTTQKVKESVTKQEATPQTVLPEAPAK